jgi:hypothetical protein
MEKKEIKKVVCVKSNRQYAKKGIIYIVVDEYEGEYCLLCYELAMNKIVYPWINKNCFKDITNDNI